MVLSELDEGSALAILEFTLGMLCLPDKSLLSWAELLFLPFVNTVDLVKSDDEGSIFLTEDFDGLEGLLLDAMHDVDHQNGEVTQRAASGAQVGERLMTWSVDDQQAWNPQLTDPHVIIA